MKLDRLLATVIPARAVTLTFDLLTAKSNQHIYEPKYICDQNWVTFPS